jgi:Domain of unknown function (DUF5666)
VKASIFVGGIAAVLLAGCGSGGGTATASSATAKPSPSPSGGRGANAVSGQVASVSNGKLVVTDQSGNVTVTYTSSTGVLQTGTGSLADLTAGACVTATGLKDPSGVVTATTVTAQLNMNGVCNPPNGASPSPGAGAGGFGGGQGRGPGAGPSAPPNLTFVRGKVTGVSGQTVTVQQIAGDTVAVNVPSTARITRLVTSTTARLGAGECVTANGTRTASGTVQARNIVISAPGPNGCATGFGRAPGGAGGGGRRTGSPSPGSVA